MIPSVLANWDGYRELMGRHGHPGERRRARRCRDEVLADRCRLRVEHDAAGVRYDARAPRTGGLLPDVPELEIREAHGEAPGPRPLDPALVLAAAEPCHVIELMQRVVDGVERDAELHTHRSKRGVERVEWKFLSDAGPENGVREAEVILRRLAAGRNRFERGRDRIRGLSPR